MTGNSNTPDSPESIAIIGMAGRFPGANNIDAFWQNLRDGVESVSYFSEEDVAASGVEPGLLNDPDYVKAGAILENAEWFDASFFGITPKEAEFMDPQHRIFLECAWEALENAGYDPEAYDGSIGVYSGTGMNTYFLSSLYSNPDRLKSVGEFQTMLSNEKDFLSTRVSYKLNLKGPSINVQTACSTSLVAVYLAYLSLLNYQCDMALAGGVSVKFPQKTGYLYQEGGIASPDSRCRAFDSQARGMSRGEGSGIVVLKRLEDAWAEGDHILAVIKGAAINNDGSLKVGYTAPSVEGQAEVIATAQALAGVDAETITYVEAHGTATPLGDPIEVAALTQAFRASTASKGFCALGSLKTNIGHLDTAAGVAGLIKTTLALQHKLLPPSLNFKQPNPKIDFANSPFYVNTALSEWKAGDTPLRAGVSSFGMGGTNAHVVLEEAPPVKYSEKSRPWQLLMLSAKTDTALASATENLAEHLKNNPDHNLADVAYTLQAGRRRFSNRRFAVCQNSDEAIIALDTADPKRVYTTVGESDSRPVVFMFSGQGSQYVNMAAELYQFEPTFREHVDLCSEMLQSHLGFDLREVLYPDEEGREEATRRMNQTSTTQPALFVIEYALANLLAEWGIRPQAMIGHSIGEYVAACMAGVFSLEDVLELVALRGRLIQELPGGAMLAVALGEKEVLPLLGRKFSLAAVNGPSMCVISGTEKAVDILQGELDAKDIGCRRLHTSHAFHSDMMEPALPQFSQHLEKINLNPPRLRYVSNVTGTWITAKEATDPTYWVRHLRQTVRFAEGLSELLKETDAILLEIGPGHTLGSLTRQHPGKASEQVVLSTIRHPQDSQSDMAILLNTLGRLWTTGVQVDWSGFYARQHRRRIPLPTYPFERKRYWVAPPRPEKQRTLPMPGMPAKLDDQMSSARRVDSIPENEKERKKLMSEELTASGPINNEDSVLPAMRQDRIRSMLKAILIEVAGVDLAEIDAAATFLEIGLDSLTLIQFSHLIKSRIGVGIPFRRFIEEFQTPESLAVYLDQELPSEALPADTSLPEPEDDSTSPQSTTRRSLAVTSEALEQLVANPAEGNPGPLTTTERIMAQQLQVMSQQLEMLREKPLTKGEVTASGIPAGNGHSGQKVQVPKATAPVLQGKALPGLTEVELEQMDSQAFGPFKPVAHGSSGDLSPCQQKHLDTLIARYTKRTQESKRLAQAYRPVLADARASVNFRTLWKEMVYPVTIARASGAKVWDVDGNEYIDLIMGFGVNLFGHSPAFVREALKEQLEQEPQMVGPQSPLAGKVAELFSELTGMQRVTFCNTGSEAVMTAIRLARAVTGRNKIALFSGSYHGNFDTVLVRGQTVAGAQRTVPITPGIPPQIAKDIVVLDYGRTGSLDYLKVHAHELAAVLVEPVQSRYPDLQPREFLQELRQMTEKAGAALIFDEVITGFRIHPGGAQGWFDVQADLATYGKIIGGGMPIGVVAGKEAYMDAVDGGMWSYGDASYPQANQTFCAGTFCKHPLALAAAWAVLNQIKSKGPGLQQQLSQRTTQLAEKLNGYFDHNRVPIRIHHMGSLFYFSYSPELKFGDLIFYHLLERGVCAWGGRPYFLSTAHTTEDIDHIVQAVQNGVTEMQAAEFLPESLPVLSKSGEGLHDRFDQSSNKVTPLPSAEDSALGPRSPLNIPEMGEDPKGIFTAPLTEAQKEIWLATQMSDEASCAYNIILIPRLRGPLDLKAIKKSIQAIVDRHDALRTTFDSEGEYQEVASRLEIEIPLVDFSDSDRSQHESQIAEELALDDKQPFDLINGPLIRARILRLQEQEHLLILVTHHIICDGWSSDVLLKELNAHYSALVQGIDGHLPQPMQFSEYALWQERQQQSPEMEQAATYWLNQFEGPEPVLELPTDAPRPPIKTYNGARHTATIKPAVYQELKRVAAQQGATLFAVLLAGFKVLLYRLTGQEDVVVGIPVAGQAMVGQEDLIGHCANLLPLRSQANGDMPFTDYLASIRNVVLDAYDHQNYTFGSLLKNLDLQRDPSRVPLVSAMFNLDRAGDGDHDWAGLKVDNVTPPKGFIIFDISIDILDTGSQLQLKFDYNSDLFGAQSAHRWTSHFGSLLEGIVTDPEQPIANLPLLTEDEQHKLLVEWNDTQMDYPRDVGIQQLFEAEADRTPDAVAVVFEDTQLTYQELNRKANQLAHHLRSLAVGPETLVGICIERSLEMVVGLLGILKAGGAYVPLDPDFPKDRLELMLEDSGAPVLLTHSNLSGNLFDYQGKTILIDSDWERIEEESNENPPCTAMPENLAYVIYTSGSTGKPKGVQISQRALINFLYTMRLEPGLTSQDTLLSVTTISFDIFGLELFMPLITGAKVVLATRDNAMDGAQLIDLLRRSHASVMQATPATWRLLLEAGWEGDTSLKVLCGGEALPQDLVAPLLDGCKELWNLYGPTETTIWSTVYRIRSKEDPILIGYPIGNTQIYILNHSLQPVPVGVGGELYIGGDGLARGYLNRPELTAEKFIPHPFDSDPQARIYNTGDLARYRADGMVECLGRVDHQVKVRGFRIELGEIETVTREYPGVNQAVAIIREDSPGDKRIAAYIVGGDSKETDFSSKKIRQFLKTKLPDYMVPSYFITMQTLPLTPNGKIDRLSLPAPSQDHRKLDSTYTAPRSATEEKLASIWQAVLKTETIGVRDDFFELGGHSLLAGQVRSRINRLFNIEFPLQQLFTATTIETLADMIDTLLWSANQTKEMDDAQAEEREVIEL